MIHNNEEYRSQGNYKAAILLNEQFLREAQAHNYNDGAALCYLNLSNICISIRNYKTGLLFLKRAEALLNDSKNNPLHARLFQEYAQLNSAKGLSGNALKHNSKSLLYVRNSTLFERRKYLLNKVFTDRGYFLNRAGKTDSALMYFHKALAIENSAQINSLIAKHHLFHEEQLDSSGIYVEKSLMLIQNDTVKLDGKKGFVYKVAGDYHRTIGNFFLAQKYYRKALDSFTDINGNCTLPVIYQSFAETYKKMHNLEMEREFNIKYLVAKSNVLYDQSEVLNLLNDRVLQEKEKDFENFKFKTFFISIAGIFTVFSVFIFKYGNPKSRKALLRENADGLKNQTQQMKDVSISSANKINEDFKELVLLAKRNDSSFLTRFQEVYPEFIGRLVSINSELSGADLYLCAMIKLNFSSKEIASYMFILHKSAQQKKYRLRKKLNVPSELNLYTFFQTLD